MQDMAGESLILDKIKNDLISEIKLSSQEADVFLLVVTRGKMTIKQVSEALSIAEREAKASCEKLEGLGGFIQISDGEFESMHPRFSAVNMYRRFCERENIEFKMNLTVDNIGVALEKSYDEARSR